MLLAVDAGNSAVKFGLFDGPRLLRRWLTPYASGEVTAEGLQEALLQEGFATADLDVALASVGPHRAALERTLGALPGVRLRVLQVTPSAEMPLAYADPSKLGIDRWLNALAARARFATSVIVVDVGTATNFECVSHRGEFLGGAIAAGPQLTLDALSSRSRKLAPVQLAAPDRVLATETAAALRSGAYYGHAALIDGMVARLSAELERPLTVVGTGGYIELFAHECTTLDVIEPDLTLQGARLAWERS